MEDKKDSFFSKIKQLFNQSNGPSTRKKRMTFYTFAALGLGIALMIFGSFSPSPNDKAVSVEVKEKKDTSSEPTFGNNKNANPETMIEYEQRYENELRESLEEIIGVNNVTVMINLETTESSIYEKNVTNQKQNTDESDREGGKRKVEDNTLNEQVVIVRSGDQEEPILVRKVKPTIRGVLVVAEGANNIKVKQMIVEAVTRVLDVPNHRVSVLPKKTEGES